MPVRRGRLAETLDLRLGELRVAIRAGEMTHQADYGCRRFEELREAPAAHAGVELQVDVKPFRDLAGGNHQLQPGFFCECELAAGRRRSHDEDPRLPELVAELEAFGDGRDAERRRPGGERGAADVHRAVAVAVPLYDRPELGAGEHVEQPLDVPANRAEIDRQLRALHRGRAAAAQSRRLRSDRARAVRLGRRRRGRAPRPRPRAAARAAWPGRRRRSR